MLAFQINLMSTALLLFAQDTFSYCTYLFPKYIYSCILVKYSRDYVCRITHYLRSVKRPSYLATSCSTNHHFTTYLSILHTLQSLSHSSKLQSIPFSLLRVVGWLARPGLFQFHTQDMKTRPAYEPESYEIIIAQKSIKDVVGVMRIHKIRKIIIITK